MFIVTEVVLNNKKDITNDFLKLFEKDNYIRLEKSFDFNNINKGRWALNISVEKI